MDSRDCERDGGECQENRDEETDGRMKTARRRVAARKNQPDVEEDVPDRPTGGDGRNQAEDEVAGQGISRVTKHRHIDDGRRWRYWGECFGFWVGKGGGCHDGDDCDCGGRAV